MLKYANLLKKTTRIHHQHNLSIHASIFRINNIPQQCNSMSGTFCFSNIKRKIIQRILAPGPNIIQSSSNLYLEPTTNTKVTKRRKSTNQSKKEQTSSPYNQKGSPQQLLNRYNIKKIPQNFVIEDNIQKLTYSKDKATTKYLKSPSKKQNLSYENKNSQKKTLIQSLKVTDSSAKPQINAYNHQKLKSNKSERKTFYQKMVEQLVLSGNTQLIKFLEKPDPKQQKKSQIKRKPQEKQVFNKVYSKNKPQEKQVFKKEYSKSKSKSQAKQAFNKEHSKSKSQAKQAFNKEYSKSKPQERQVFKKEFCKSKPQAKQAFRKVDSKSKPQERQTFKKEQSQNKPEEKQAFNKVDKAERIEKNRLQKQNMQNRISVTRNNRFWTDQNKKLNKQLKVRKTKQKTTVLDNEYKKSPIKTTWLGIESQPEKVQSDQMLQTRPITTLKSVLNQVSQQMEIPDPQYFQQNYFYVLNPDNTKPPLVPYGFKYFLFKLTKNQMHYFQSLPQQDIANFQLKTMNTAIYYCIDQKQDKGNKNILKLPQDRIKYMQHFLTNLLGYNSEFFYDIFLQIGINYFQQLKQRMRQPQKQPNKKPYIPSRGVLQILHVNIQRLIKGQQEDIKIDTLNSQDYSRERQLFSLFLDFYCIRKLQFDTNDKIMCTNTAKFLKIQHPEFLQFLKETIQTDQQNYSAVEFLTMLGYLVECKNTPYEYFYKNKGSWMKIIESAHDFSNQKTKSCISFLEILSRERFVNCQKIYSSLLKSIESNLEAMEGKQLVRLLYFYSKTKYGTNDRFLSNLVDKISRWLPMLDQNNFSLLVRAVGNLNYQSAELVQKLKNIDYQRFLNELKYGCENLGSYYQQILKEVEQQSKGRYYSNADQIVIDPSINLTQIKSTDQLI